MKIDKRTVTLLLSLLLIIITLITFSRVRGFDFVHYDDDTYVLENPHIQAGITPATVAWAFTATDAGFWHPLTWLSLMLDYELYNLNPGGYHGTNLILHLLNTVLLFLIFSSMSGASWRSAFVAGLFALHPLHVESVAWIAERKDVLSTLFWLLTMATYVAYAKCPSLSRYLLVILAYSLGLMAKPMLVTLPFVLLLLDFWPLGRFPAVLWKRALREGAISGLMQQQKLGLLLLEKLPLLLLAFLASALAFYTESHIGALASFDAYPLTVRISHALVSYLLYIGKMFWPIHLAVFYPHPGQWPLFIVGAAMVSLVAITFLSISLIRRAPYLAVGWFWYLGTMAPVIGFIQLGTQGMADRYTYVPLIGIFVAIAWGVPALMQRWQKNVAILPLAALIILSLAGYLGWRQAGYWQDAETLFRHALAVTDNNYLAHNNLGAALAREGKPDAALTQYRAALRLKPHYVDAIFNMGQALADAGRFAEAEEQYRNALELKPSFVEAHNNLGILLAREGKTEEAVSHFVTALRIRPEYEAVGKNLRLLLQEQLKKPAK